MLFAFCKGNLFPLMAYRVQIFASLIRVHLIPKNSSGVGASKVRSQSAQAMPGDLPSTLGPSLPHPCAQRNQRLRAGQSAQVQAVTGQQVVLLFLELYPTTPGGSVPSLVCVSPQIPGGNGARSSSATERVPELSRTF